MTHDIRCCSLICRDTERRWSSQAGGQQGNKVAQGGGGGGGKDSGSSSENVVTLSKIAAQSIAAKSYK